MIDNELLEEKLLRLQSKFHPDRFINTGVGENNAIGVASGMAMSGKKIFVYSIVPFLIFRNLEIIRNYISHNCLNITLVGAGGGFSYGNQGISHNTFEDFAIIRTLPNFRIYSPATKQEVVKCSKEIFEYSGPVYIRLGKAPDTDHKSLETVENLGEIYKKGKDILIISTGNLIDEVIKSSDQLNSVSLDSTVLSINKLKPIDDIQLSKILSEYNNIITVEENGIIGGINSIISDIKSKKDIKGKIFSLALGDKVHKEIGDQDYLRTINKIDNLSITQFIKNKINK